MHFLELSECTTTMPSREKLENNESCHVPGAKRFVISHNSYVYPQDSATTPFYRWGNWASETRSIVPTTTQLWSDWTIIQTQSRGSESYAPDHHALSQHSRIPVYIQLGHVSQSPGGPIKTDCWAHPQSPQKFNFQIFLIDAMGVILGELHLYQMASCLSLLSTQRPCAKHVHAYWRIPVPAWPSQAAAGWLQGMPPPSRPDEGQEKGKTMLCLETLSNKREGSKRLHRFPVSFSSMYMNTGKESGCFLGRTWLPGNEVLLCPAPTAPGCCW